MKTITIVIFILGTSDNLQLHVKLCGFKIIYIDFIQLSNNFSGPRSRQSSVETNETTLQMNTEEVYRSLRKTTAEIQNYSFETKLGRDTNSKDSGISQMDDQQPGHTLPNELIRQQQYCAVNQAQPCVNGYNKNGLSSADKEDSCNGSKTQSATTTESNTPENTVRMDGEITARSSFTAKHSNNVTFLPNGELVTECTF